MSETLTGRTTRTVTFIDEGNTLRMVRKPAGTFVYARQMDDGTLRIRVPQTLLSQTVSLATVYPI